MGMRSGSMPETLRLKLAIPNAERIFHLAQAFQDGMSIDEVFELTKIDRWFLHNVRQIVEEQGRLLAHRRRAPRSAPKKLGFSDRQLAVARGVSEAEIRAERKAAGVVPTYRLVDTCAAEFEAFTPYYYSTYGTRERDAAQRQAQDHDPRRWTESHRAGHRV